MDSQLAAEESANGDSPPPPSQPDNPRGSQLDAVIEQLLKDRPRENDATYLLKKREHDDLSRLNSVECVCTQGDTLAIVNFPTGYRTCNWEEEWSSKRFSIHSEKLLATGSEVFKEWLSPSQQTRFRKRAELDEVSITHHKYVIDFTPPIEGEELAAQYEQLSLPSPVRDWWMSMQRLGVSRFLVSGHDDHCPHHHVISDNCVRPGTDDTDQYVHDYDENIDLSDVKTPAARVLEEYCPIRHRANIIRLLLAIEGHELILNSAPRVYTLAGIAKTFDCGSVIYIRDPMYTWFMAEPNYEFIDINTEVAFKIGWIFKLNYLTRVSFRILVVEKALDTLAIEPRKQQETLSLFGRPHTDLFDDMKTAVEYASQTLAGRVQQTHADLSSDKFFDLYEILEQRKLIGARQRIQTAFSAIAGPDTHAPLTQTATMLNQLLDLLNSIAEKLLAYKDLILRNAEKADPSDDQQSYFDRDRRCYVPRANWQPTAAIYSTLSARQRLLTPCFWDCMADDCLSIHTTHEPSELLFKDATAYNDKLEELANTLDSTGDTTLADLGGPDVLRFNFPQFRHEFSAAMDQVRIAWTKPRLNVPLNRTRHLSLGLSDAEFGYLPLWAGGLNDETLAASNPPVPDTETGPIGPGPAYRTGDTVATEVSSIGMSDATPSHVSTVTLTAGRSLVAAQSGVGPSSASASESAAQDVASLSVGETYQNDQLHDAVVVPSAPASDVVIVDSPAVTTMSTPLMSESESDDSYGFEVYYDTDDGTDDEVWSQVEEP